MSTLGASGQQQKLNIAQQAGLNPATVAPKQVRTKDAEETRRTESHRDDEEGSSRPGGAKEKASAETAASFAAGDGAKVKPKKRKNRQVSVGGASGSKSSRRAAQTSQSGGSQQNQGADKTDGSRSRYGNSGRYSDERSHQIVTKHQTAHAATTQASVKFEQTQRAAQGNDANPLSAAGQRRMMLENLSRMVKIGLEQHTGGTAGEAYPRRETRQIFSALQGLKAGGQPTASNETRRTDSRNVTNGEFKLKESRMNNVLAIFLDPPAPPEGHEPLELVA